MQDLRSILTHEGVIALYQYDRDEHMIPVIVVRDHSVIDQNRTREYNLGRYHGIIILTMDDVHEGADAFALTFAHLQMRSVFVGGEYDIFSDLTLQIHHIRLQMEVLARQLLIDAREHYLRGASISDFSMYLLRAQDRLTVGYEIIGETYAYDISSVNHRESLIQNLLAIVDQIDILEDK